MTAFVRDPHAQLAALDGAGSCRRARLSAMRKRVRDVEGCGPHRW
jgi:hypothetical protein